MYAYALSFGFALCTGLQIVAENKGAFVLAALTGAAVNFASYMVIKATSTLTLKVG